VVTAKRGKIDLRLTRISALGFLLFFLILPTAFAANSQFPTPPDLTTFGSHPGSQVTSFDSISSTEAVFNYDVRPIASFTGLVLNWNDAGCPPACGADDYIDLSAHANPFNPFVLELAVESWNRGTSGTFQLKIELNDIFGRQAFFFVNGLNNQYQTKSLPFAQIPVVFPNFDLTKVKNFIFVVDHNTATNEYEQGFLKIRSAGFGHVVPNGSLNSGDVTPLDFKLSGAIDGDGDDSEIRVEFAITSEQTSMLDFVLPSTGFAGVFHTFDDPETMPQVETKNLSSYTNLVVGIRAPPLLEGGPYRRIIKFEIKDAAGHVESVRIDGTNNALQFYQIPLALFPHLNIASVKEINFVIEKPEGPVANSYGPGGTIELNFGAYNYIPPVTGNTYNPSLTTDLMGAELTSETSTAGGTINFTQDSQLQFHFDYTLADTQFVYTQAGYGYFDMANVFQGTPHNLGSALTFAVTGPDQKKLKVEVLDAAGKVARFYLLLTGSAQNYTLALSGNNIPSGFDTAQIALVNFVSDFQQMGASGSVQVEAQGFNYIPPVTGNTYNPSLTTDLMGAELTSETSTAGGTINFTQDSQLQFHFDYTLADTQFVYTQAGYGYFDMANVFQGTPHNLGSALTFAVTGPDQKKLKVEVLDAAGKVARFYLLLTGSAQNYTLALSGNNIPSGFDTAQIALVNFVSDFQQMGASGSVQVEAQGFNFQDTLTPDPSLQVGDESHFNFHIAGDIDSDGAGTDVSAVLQTLSETTAQTSFTVNDTGFAGTYHKADNPGTPAVEKIDLSSATDIIIGLRGPAGLKVKFELHDEAGGIDSVKLIGQDGTNNKFYRISTSAFTGVVLTDITEMNLVVEGAENPNVSGVLHIFFGNYVFTVLPNPLLGLGDITHLDIQNFGGFDDDGAGLNGTTVTFNQIASTHVRLDYQFNTAGGFAGLFTNYAAPVNLTALGNLIFGLKAPSGTIVRLQLKDSLGATKTVPFGGLDGVNEVFYSNFLQLFTGVDLTNIDEIVWLINRSEQTTLTGQLDLRFGIFAFAQSEIAPDPNKTANDVTVLPSTPRVGRTGGSYDGSDVLQISSEQFDFVYNGLSDPGRFAGVTVRYDDFTTPEPAIETGDLSSFSELVFGVSAIGTSKVKVEFEDGDENRIIIPLGSASSTTQYYVIEPQNFTGLINFAEIRFINFIVDTASVTDEEGVVRCDVKGLFYDDQALNIDQQALRLFFLNQQMLYFRPTGAGIDSVTHLPYDNINAAGTPGGQFTQLTAIGFYLQILGEVARGRVTNGPMTRQEALQEMVAVLDQVILLQGQMGWNGTGLLPAFIELNPYAPGEFVSFGDNSNMSQSIAASIGIVEALSGLSPAEQTLKSQITAKGEQVLIAQGPGYVQFYNPNANANFGLFRLSYNLTTNQFEHHVDKLANEFRTGVSFVTTRYASLLPSNIGDMYANSLDQATKVYEDQSGTSLTNLVPYDGGAFQMFWPFIWVNEHENVNMIAAHRNFLYTAFDYSNRYKIPGFLSASYIPENGYVGPLGIPEAAEKDFPYANVFDVGSFYSLAGAYNLNPPLVMSWLFDILEQYPQIFTPYGIVDGLRSGTEIDAHLVAVNQASSILGLLGGQGDDLERYFQNRGELASYKQKYDNLHLEFSSLDQVPIGTPESFPDKSLSVVNRFNDEGPIGNAIDTSTSIFGTTIAYINENSDFSGHYWLFDQEKDIRGHQLVVIYTAVTSPGEFRIELKNAGGNILAALPVQITAENQMTRAVFNIPDDAAFSGLRSVTVVTEPNTTQIHTANLFIHQLNFFHYPVSGVIPPDPEPDPEPEPEPEPEPDTDSQNSTPPTLPAPPAPENPETGTQVPENQKPKKSNDFLGTGFIGFVPAYNNTNTEPAPSAGGEVSPDAPKNSNITADLAVPSAKPQSITKAVPRDEAPDPDFQPFTPDNFMNIPNEVLSSFQAPVPETQPSSNASSVVLINKLNMTLPQRHVNSKTSSGNPVIILYEAISNVLIDKAATAMALYL